MADALPHFHAAFLWLALLAFCLLGALALEIFAAREMRARARRRAALARYCETVGAP